MAETLDQTASLLPKWSSKKTDAVNDTDKTNEDNPVTINVLANDKNALGVYKIFPVKQISDVSLPDNMLTESVAAAESYTTALLKKPYTITLESGSKVELLQDGTVRYDPNGRFEHLNEGQTATDSFGYAVYGRYNTDWARVDVTITGVDDPTTGNQPPVAFNDYVFVNSYPYPYPPQPYPYPETYSMSSAEADASGETSTVEADLSDDLIYTTLAIGEEGDPYPLPESTTIDVLWNDYDPEGDKISVGTINGKPLDVGDSITLPGTKAVVTLNEDGTLTYKGGILDYYSSDPLAAESDATFTVSEGTDGQISLVETELWEPVPLPYPKPILFDSFKYQAKEVHTDVDAPQVLSNEATVFVYRDYLYYYDGSSDAVLNETSKDVSDPGIFIA